MVSKTRRGRLVAAALRGAWRGDPPAPDIEAAAVALVAPLLLRSGAGGLAWWRWHRSARRPAPELLELFGAHRLQALHAAAQEERIAAAFAALGAAGVTPLLGKGWAVGRFYPEPGLRPYGDIDVYVPPGQLQAARAALDTDSARACGVDLHCGAPELDDRGFDGLLERGRAERLRGVEVGVFGPEDHLRLLCLHMLRHGAWRPLWLCDVAVAIESRPADFDWRRFLDGEATRTDWSVCALRLAEDLLGARLEGAPPAVRGRRLPSWLGHAVLRQWGETGFEPHGLRQPMASHWPHPRRVVAALVERWPNPIEATVGVGGRFDSGPRWLLQLAECARRIARFALPPPSGQPRPPARG